MYICRYCDRPFIEPDYITEPLENVEVCPYCGSSEFFTPSEYDGRE